VENADDEDPKAQVEFVATAKTILGQYGYKHMDHIEYGHIFMKN
jgi:hypothetical protein